MSASVCSGAGCPQTLLPLSSSRVGFALQPEYFKRLSACAIHHGAGNGCTCQVLAALCYICSCLASATDAASSKRLTMLPIASVCSVSREQKSSLDAAQKSISWSRGGMMCRTSLLTFRLPSDYLSKST